MSNSSVKLKEKRLRKKLIQLLTEEFKDQPEAAQALTDGKLDDPILELMIEIQVAIENVQDGF